MSKLSLVNENFESDENCSSFQKINHKKIDKKSSFHPKNTVRQARSRKIQTRYYA